MKKTSLRVTVCLVLFVLILSFLSSVISERTFRLGQAAFLREIRRPPCAFSRCTNGKKRAIAAIKRVLTKNLAQFEKELQDFESTNTENIDTHPAEIRTIENEKNHQTMKSQKNL